MSGREDADRQSPPGATTVRATTSAAVSSAPPRSAEAGSSRRWSAPTMRRRACGTTMPTKPMMPAAATRRADGDRDEQDRSRLHALRRGCRDGRPPPRRATRALRPRPRNGTARSAGRMNGRRPARPSSSSRRSRRTERPEGEVAQLPVVAEIGEEARQRLAERAEGDAGEEHRGDRGAALAGRRAVEASVAMRPPRRRSPAAPRRAAVRRTPDRRTASPKHDRDAAGESSARRDADEARIGEGIAEQPLHHGAGKARAAPTEQPSRSAAGAPVG